MAHDATRNVLKPWNGWYHVTGSTYGSWVRGDERGWRARHHREHVEGDYRHRPDPRTHAGLRQLSREAMTRAPVVLSPEARRVACEEIARSLLAHQLDVVAVCVSARHYHILARLRPEFAPTPKPTGQAPWATTPISDAPRHFVGIAKMRSAHLLRKLALVPDGGTWAKRSRCLPVKDRAHQLSVARYIAKHTREGAAVWTIKQARPGAEQSSGS